MTKLSDAIRAKLDALASPTPSNWREKAMWRQRNREWLEKIRKQQLKYLEQGKPIMENNKIYISGAISGLDLTECKKDFAWTAECLAKLGYDTVNPFDNGLPEGSTWEQHLVKDLEMLRGCDAIFMKFGWEESRGARLELAFAELHGIKIIYWNE